MTQAGRSLETPGLEKHVKSYHHLRRQRSPDLGDTSLLVASSMMKFQTFSLRQPWGVSCSVLTPERETEGAKHGTPRVKPEPRPLHNLPPSPELIRGCPLTGKDLAEKSQRSIPGREAADEIGRHQLEAVIANHPYRPYPLPHSIGMIRIKD
ncbi:hypothetical protein CDAR_92861 [Caerostris darwini]|uniref:Uncharacterized protein n=1 Tax=Caerostris darwini TaxID=1538125 RepID=A0AAV4PIN8_9ARAC|nr:hypothetical protein CDAR_92861 [Caerostris darwini]